MIVSKLSRKKNLKNAPLSQMYSLLMKKMVRCVETRLEVLKIDIISRINLGNMDSYSTDRNIILS